MAPKFHRLTVIDISRCTTGAVVLSFDLPKTLKPHFQFQPGQYLTLKAEIDGQAQRRSYSISSALGADHLEVGIRLLPGGIFSNYAAGLKVGDQLEVMEPQGRFVAATGGAVDYLLLAAGSGITPMMSIAASTLAANAAASITLVYGNRQIDSIMFRAQLEALKDRYMGRLTVIHLLSQQEQDIFLLNGRLDAEKITRLIQVGAIDPLAADGVFICGPGGLIAAAKAVLAKLGVASGKIHFERFLPEGGAEITYRPSGKAQQAVAGGARVEVIIDGTRKQFELEDTGESVLEGARRQGLDLPFSCKGGMCCTCRCKVVKGSAEMAVNYSLEPWEIEAGFTLACQARATSKELVLDFDAS